MRSGAAPLLQIEGVSLHYPVLRGLMRRRAGTIRAVQEVSFALHRGRTLGLVGESGSGKTSLARLILRLIEPSAGRILFDGHDITAMGQRVLRRMRPRMQMIFQDPLAALNPRMTVASIIAEPLEEHGRGNAGARRRRVAELLETVGLDPSHGDRYPHEFSGGQRQRIGIARALALDPDLIVCDEPIAALDVSIQAQIINLLRRLQRERNLTYVFISHDLAMVRHIADEVAVMYLGRFVETGPASTVFARPSHPYTRALLAAAAATNREGRGRRTLLRGDPGAQAEREGCPFGERCPEAVAICRRVMPIWRATGADQHALCHFPEGIPDGQRLAAGRQEDSHVRRVIPSFSREAE